MNIIGKIGSAVVVALALSLAAPSPALAAPGQLDRSFSGDGKVATNITAGDEVAFGVAVQPDGKIVAAGWAQGSGGRFALTRYNANGSLDTSFSDDGKLTTNFTAGLDGALAVAVQADGKIVAAGGADGSGGRFALTRYNANGSLDTSFSGDGKLTTDFTTGLDFASDVAVQADGKIVAAGRAGGSGGRFALARYNTDGSLDTSFSGDGKQTTNFTTGDDTVEGVALQADGKIVVAGWVPGSGGRFALARYTATGGLDTSFSGDGKQTTNFTTGDDFAMDVAVQANGKIVAAGRAGGSGGRFALARYNVNGSLDTSFSGDGKAAANFTTRNDGADGVAIQADGKIVAAGWAAGDGGRFALTRYRANGTLDTTFSGDGKLTTNFTTGDDFAADVAIQPNGKIVAAGRAGGSGGRFAVARYLAV